MTAEDVKKLRDMTGAGVMDAKKALEEAQGDIEKAVSIIGEKGLMKAEKKADRTTGAGLLVTYIHNERIGVLLELRCETDFVARLDEFKALGHDIAMHIAAMDPEDQAELLSQPFIKDQAVTIENLIKSFIAKTGENVQLGRFCRYAV
ncbi:MAG: translation elongation factor Ts [Candidatus Colwellbacteria bacterium]|nr:translation elongation factor Ts [Candidatus Colwellbacteria bacterium]